MPSDPATRDTVARARAFAVEAHGDQRYGEHPYAVHLDAVADLARPYGADAETVAYLHDVVEDTLVPPDRVRESFGDLVADCVALVTDAPGANRSERKMHTNAKLAEVAGDRQLALIVKACDRLANLRQSAHGAPGSKLDMYRAEHPAFRDAAYRPRLCDELWAEMDRVLAQVPSPHREAT
jgi:(p)ppGpp synthase/HD superfamily hydrolase